MNILVVDDEKLNLTIARDFIHSAMGEWNVILCNSPFDVINIIEKNNIDIVLLDIMMPGMDGFEVLQEIRSIKEYNNIQIVMLTSLGDKENFKKCFEIGADDYLLKPINITEFTARLKAAAKTRSNALMLKEAFEQIKHQNKELKDLNKKLEDTTFHMIQKEKLASIGELAAGVAHEINNPIGFIGSNLETMSVFLEKIQKVVGSYRELVSSIKSGQDNPETIRDKIQQTEEIERKNKFDFIMSDLSSIIKDSQDGIERVSKIVQSLRGFARTGFEDEMNYCDLNVIIDEALLIIQNEAKYSIDIENIKGMIPEVFCNKGQIGQVLLNIVVNAIHAIKSVERADRGKIRLETYFDEGFICCKITDDGPGIGEDVIGRIFDPFFTTKDVGIGTGLGLSISYDIVVKNHKGELVAESEPGKGAEFTIRLPEHKDFEQ